MLRICHDSATTDEYVIVSSVDISVMLRLREILIPALLYRMHLFTPTYLQLHWFIVKPLVWCRQMALHEGSACQMHSWHLTPLWGGCGDGDRTVSSNSSEIDIITQITHAPSCRHVVTILYRSCWGLLTYTGLLLVLSSLQILHQNL